MLFALALIPVVVLLIYIYVKDKNEKEPIGLLTGLFFAGMATTITALIAEVVGELILDVIFPYKSVLRMIVFAMFIVAPAEELGKYFILRIITWKNKHFDYSYDAIVYAVCVSLGFALLENIGYVFSNGLTAALVRMFTAVPGHACFAVYMGFFYSKAKYASLTMKKSEYRKNISLAIFIPILLHGVYDAIAMGGTAADEAVLTGLALILWFAFVIALLVVSCIVINKASENDYCIITLPGARTVQTVYRPSVVGEWTCSCGAVNPRNFCSQCGKPRPTVSMWICPTCGTSCSLNFCGHCGCAKPAAAPIAPAQPVQYAQPVQPARSGVPVQPRPMPQPVPMQGSPVQPAAPAAPGEVPFNPYPTAPGPMIKE